MRSDALDEYRAARKRRLIRLQRLRLLDAPKVIIKNEQRILLDARLRFKQRRI